MKTITLTLVGLDGNAFAIMGAFTKQARREGWTADEIDAVINEAMAGDYDHLLRTISKYCDESNQAENAD
jgi:sugar diacid utilization regulator